MQADYRVPLIALAVLVISVLLIACVNVANLLAAQAAAQEKDLALRISIGAGRGRLLQLVLVECALLASASAAAGLWLMRWFAPFIANRINPADTPAQLDLAPDWRVIGFALAATTATVLLCGWAPAVRVFGIQPQILLKGGADPRSRRRLMRALIAVQVGFCFLVVFVSGLFLTTFRQLSKQPLGFSAERLLAIDIVTPRFNEPFTSWEQVAIELRQTRGVEEAAFADWPLLDGYSFKMNSLSINGGRPSAVPAWFLNVSPGWFGTMGIPLIAGRDFRPADLSPGVAIVNQAFARQYFENVNPIGQFFEGTSGYMRGQRFQIVGLVRDTGYRYLRQPVVPVAFTPFHRLDGGGSLRGGTFVVRASMSNSLALASILNRAVTRTRPEFRVSRIRTQRQVIQTQTIRERLLALLALFFGFMAVLLAGIGMYGVLDDAVVQRRREIGIRMAIGAQGPEIARRVMSDIVLMVLAGAAGGTGLGMASVRYLESLLYQVKATSPAMLSLPSLVVLGAALLAATPALLHAVRVDPAEILRSE